MTVEEILVKRRKTQQKKLSKYAKYIMNDHFVIAFMFLLGALALQYSNFIKTLTPDFIWGKIAASLLLATLIYFGKIGTMATAADQVFLVTQEEEWQILIRKAKKRSMILPSLLLIFGIAFFMPVAYIGQTLAMGNLVFLFFTGILLKWVHLSLEEVALRFNSGEKVKRGSLLLWLMGAISYLVAFFVNPLVGFLAASVVYLLFEWQLSPLRKHLLDWERMVATESLRMAKINRFINVFIDAPTGKEHAKRRRYLDGVVRRLSRSQNPYQYLIARAFLRGNSYFGLYMRLTVLGMFILALSEMPVFNVLLGILLLYLTGFQLLPLYSQVSDNVMVRLYPQTEQQRQQGFLKVLTFILGAQAILFALATSVGTNVLFGAIAAGTNVVFILFFGKIYVKKRLRKRHSNFL